MTPALGSGLAWLAALRLAAGAPLPGGADTLLLEVAAHRVPCTGEAPQRCLRVRTPRDTAWRLFYDPIAGYVHEEGVRVLLEVERTRVPRPPADGSAWRWRLVRVRARAVEDR